jgi:hypothetical protein
MLPFVMFDVSRGFRFVSFLRFLFDTSLFLFSKIKMHFLSSIVPFLSSKHLYQQAKADQMRSTSPRMDRVAC